MKLLAIVVLAVVAARAVVVEAQSPTSVCRCEAKFEYLYQDRRLLADESRDLTDGGYAYDYGDAYFDTEGYYVVEGVRVLPKTDPACRESALAVSGFRGIFDHNRNLIADDEDREEEEVGVPHKRSLGKDGTSGKGSKGQSYQDDDYYYTAESNGGKGKVSCKGSKD